MRDRQCTRDIPGENSAGEGVYIVICDLDSFIFVLELDDRSHRSENLFTDNSHVGPAVGEDGRLNEVTRISMSLAAQM